MLLNVKGNKDIANHELEELINSKFIAIDTETTGLNAKIDKLCTIQIFNGNIGFLFNFDPNNEYLNLRSLFSNSDIIKIFHNAVFDVNFLTSNFGKLEIENIVCTKISSKIINGVEANNSLKGLIKRYLNIDINKQQQLSDWSKVNLSKDQIEYAMNDVRYLYDLWSCLEKELINNKLYDDAKRCFNFIPIYIKLYNKGIDNIFTY